MTKKKKFFSIFFSHDKSLYLILTALSLIILILCAQDTINYDEYFSMQWCRSDWKELLQELINDVHPPLYYIMLKPILDLTGESMFCARLLSTLSGILLLWTGALFLSHNFGPKSAFFFIAFLYFNPFMVQKVAEIRMYMPASAFTVISGIMSFYILKEPKRKNWILFTVFSLLAAYTHYYALLAMVFLYAGILIYFAVSRCRKGVWGWLLCSLFTVIGYLPWLPTAFRQISAVNQSFWLTAPSSRLEPLRELFYTRIPWTEHIYLGIIVVLTMISILFFLQKRTVESYWACVCCSALWGTFLLTAWYSSQIRPVLISRYLIMALCLTVAGASYAARFLPKYILLIICLYCAVIGGNLYIRYAAGALTQHTTTKTLAFAQENFEKGDLLLYNTPPAHNNNYFELCLEYYFPDTYCINMEDALTAYPECEMPNTEGTIWVLDTDRRIAEQAGSVFNKEMESCGNYGFGSLSFEIYRLK